MLDLINYEFRSDFKYRLLLCMINNYYSYPIEEYGPGFKTRPLRPFFTETRFTKPDFKCYNSIIRYSLEHSKSVLAWKISPRAEK